MSEPVVLIERDGGVATLRFNRPKVNAIDPDLLEQLNAAVAELGADPGVRVVVVTSALERYFMAGADIKMMGAAREAGRDPASVLTDALSALERLPKPVIAAVNGHALGGGCELALCCDYRFMLDDGHSTIGLTETSLGIIPGGGGTQRLPRLIGRARATQMIFEARRLSAREAQAVGLVDEALAPGAFEPGVRAKALQLAGMATRALALAKLAVLDGLDLPLRDGLRREREHFAEVLRTADAGEGLQAFIGKRPANFIGR